MRVELESPPALGHQEAEGPDVGHCMGTEIQEHTDGWVAGAEKTGEGARRRRVSLSLTCQRLIRQGRLVPSFPSVCPENKASVRVKNAGAVGEAAESRDLSCCAPLCCLGQRYHLPFCFVKQDCWTEPGRRNRF